MRTVLLTAASFTVLMSLMSSEASAQGVRVFAGQPGPYEVHEFLHRPNSYDRPPYYAVNPPVYYTDQRVYRTYGWTPYPYWGMQYEGPLYRASEEQPGKMVPAEEMRNWKDRNYGSARTNGMSKAERQ
jgi:hypothetical protein